MGDFDCGFGFETGRDYVVYAHGAEGQLETGICTGTALVDEPENNDADDIAADPDRALVAAAAIAFFAAGVLSARIVGRRKSA
jgi:hypothetical protein